MDLLVSCGLRQFIIRLASQEELALRDAFQAAPRHLLGGYDRIRQEGRQ